MENLSISVGNIITDTKQNTRYRIIGIQLECAILCQMDTTKLDIKPLSVSTIMERLIDGSLTMITEEKQVFDYDTLTEKQQEDYMRKKDVIDDVVEAFGPTYLGLQGRAPKPLLESIMNEYDLPRNTLLRWIRTFLQSGLDYVSLIKLYSTASRGGYGTYNFESKSGKHSPYGVTYGIPLSDDVLKHFEEALKEYKSGRMTTIRKAYDNMLRKHYTNIVQGASSIEYHPMPATERPTYDQFYYYVRNNLSAKERDIIKTSAMEVRNNNRLLLSDVMFDVAGPCDRVQMDECEVDLSLISSLNENQSVGRPIVYVMSDVYTRMIMAVGVAFDNNSVIGMTNCFLNLAEDKVAYCAKYGIEITPEQWPSGYLPNRILVDRGSEYCSKEASRIFNEINVSRELVSAGTGSLKGVVEQWFHQMQSMQNPSLEGSGQISKRHDSKHHKESCLTIDEFTKILITYIVYHNTHLIEGYHLEPEMIAQDVDAIPVSLWQYGCKRYGNPRSITNINQYCYSLMLPQKATINRQGITCNGLKYINMSDSELIDQMYEQQNTRAPFECRIDPRDIGSVYYLRDNQMMSAPLNSSKFGNAAFAGLTLAEWLVIQRFLNAKKRELMITKAEHRGFIEHMNDLIVANAQKTIPSDVSELTKNRSYEKHFIQSRNSMFLMLQSTLQSQFGVIPEFAETDETIEALTIDETEDTETLPVSEPIEPVIQTDKDTSENKDDATDTVHELTNEELMEAMKAFNKRHYGV